MLKDVIVLVGAGVGGSAILRILLKMPGIEVRSVVDVNPEAPGMVLAREYGISSVGVSSLEKTLQDPEVGLIFEVTGKDEVFQQLKKIKLPDSVLIGASGTKIIFHLLHEQNQANQKLEEYQATLKSKIFERTEALALTNSELQIQVLEYEQLNQKLEQINEEKTRYLLQATHQLKAPFAAIQSYADVVIEGFVGHVSEPVRDIMKKIKRRCEFLTLSIQDMLQLASLKTTGKGKDKGGVMSVGKMMNELKDHYKDQAEKRDIEIVCEILDEEAKVAGNKKQLVTLFSVLIDNAINYSNDSSKIELSVKKISERWINVAIKDHGIGIPDHNIVHIFKEYFRSNNAAAKHENGSGLGLAIVKEIAELHNSTVNVESKLGEGSTFTVNMPLAK